MKIGILGGTFNPVHAGHIYLARKYYEKLALDRVVLVPTYIPPHKSSHMLADAETRMEMLRLAIEECTWAELCDYEIAEQGRSYTFKTLKHLKTQYSDAEFYLLMGADMFLTVQDWRQPKEIYRLATLCAAERETGEFSLLETHRLRLEIEGARCMILDMEPMPLSSTMIREGIRAGEDVSGLLAPKVWEYIRKNGLYGL